MCPTLAPCCSRPNLIGFVNLLGVIALMGMIQRNSVILIEQIEQDRAAGVAAWDAFRVRREPGETPPLVG